MRSSEDVGGERVQEVGKCRTDKWVSGWMLGWEGVILSNCKEYRHKMKWKGGRKRASYFAM